MVEGGGVSVVGASYIIEREDVVFGVDLVRSGNFDRMKREEYLKNPFKA